MSTLQQTRGYFKLAGIVSGVRRQDFFKDTTTKTGKNRKAVKFAIQTSAENKVFVTLAGQPMDFVYYSKRAEKKGEKSETKKVPWEKRKDFKEEGFNLIGVNVGLSKKLDKEGKEVNDIQYAVAYDAVQLINENLRDGMSVFVRGNIEYSTFEGRNIQQYVINQISLCQDIDFAQEGFTETASWEQPIVFKAVNKDTEEAGKWRLTGDIITYNDVVETDFVIRNEKIAKTLSKNLKPYYAVKVHGSLIGRTEEVVVEDDDDGWGEANPMNAMGSYYREMLVTGADKTSVDSELYSEEAIEEFLRGKKEFGTTTTTTSATVEEDDDEDWDV